MNLRTTITALLPAICSALGLRRDDDHDLSRREIGNRAMCWWESPASAIIRDQVFINGGALAFANISVLGPPQIETNYIPTASYYLELGNAFNVSNVPFRTLDTDFAQVSDGFMAANDNSFWLYGGLFEDTGSIPNFPDADEIMAYDVYRQGPERTWREGWQFDRILSSGVNRFVAGGAGVNVRTLNQTYYFSGARGKTWGDIRGGYGVRPQFLPIARSSQLIIGNLDEQVTTKWTNTTLPGHVRPRVSAEMVYVPVGDLGVLVVVGGVLNADWQNQSPTDEEISSGAYSRTINETVRTGPSFLRTVEIYDLNTNTWYLQNTTGEIPTTGLAKHCAVVASAEDGSSHQIYVYGGYPGLAEVDPMPYFDDVWVLSIPAFEWIKVHNGTSQFARQGHKCVKPLPDQMMIIGGRPAARTSCTDIVRIFNFNKLAFMDSYEPAVFEPYKVPEPIRRVIGGSETGGATKVAARWSNPTLETIFVSDRPPQLVPTWYPYSPTEENGDSMPTISIIQTKTEVPKYVYPVVAVCVVLVLGIIGACIFFFWKKKKNQRAASIAAGHEQFQGEGKDVKYDTYPQYPSPHTSPWGTANSMTTLGPMSQSGHSRQLSVDGYSMEHSGNNLYELQADRGPVELEANPETKLSAVQEYGGEFSIVPTPATEAADPMNGLLRPQPSTRTGMQSAFSEGATTPTDDGIIISPLSPDPEIPSTSIGAQMEQAGNTNNNGWWRKVSGKGSKGAKRFSSFSSSRSGSKSGPKSPTSPT